MCKARHIKYISELVFHSFWNAGLQKRHLILINRNIGHSTANFARSSVNLCLDVFKAGLKCKIHTPCLTCLLNNETDITAQFSIHHNTEKFHPQHSLVQAIRETRNSIDNSGRWNVSLNGIFKTAINIFKYKIPYFKSFHLYSSWGKYIMHKITVPTIDTLLV